MVVWTGGLVSNIKLVTEVSEFSRSEAGSIVGDDVLGESKMSEGVIQCFLDS